MRISKKAVDLIKRFEGIDTLSRWPGYSSGITCMRGYDIGYESEVEKVLRPYLTYDEWKRLKPAIGLKGLAAKAYAPKLKGITFSIEETDQVFEAYTIPKQEAKTMKVFPGIENLHPDVFGALTSLVFNRGPLVDNSDRRREMLEIHKMFVNKKVDLNKVADLVDNMKRLWPNKKTGYDLYARRQAEAKLIREAV